MLEALLDVENSFPVVTPLTAFVALAFVALATPAARAGALDRRWSVRCVFQPSQLPAVFFLLRSRIRRCT